MTSQRCPSQRQPFGTAQTSPVAAHCRAQPKRARPTLTRCATNAQAASAPDTAMLGKSGLVVSALGIGTLQWGDPQCGFNKQYSKEQLSEVFEAAVQGGVTFFDTAEVYGYQGIKSGQSSEHLVGKFAKQKTKPVVIGTKFFTIPWTNFLVGGGFRLGRQSMIKALRASLQRLGQDKIDLYQIHFPFPTYKQSVLADGLKEAVDLGLTKAVGVCNYDSAQLEEIHGLLDKSGIAVATNQVKYNVLDTSPEASGLLSKCQDLGVTLVAHSPLQQGILTDRYVSEGGPAEAEKARILLKLMQFIGAVSGGKTVTQVALNYLMCKGCKSVAQVQDHVGALGWRLDSNDIAIIDERRASLK